MDDLRRASVLSNSSSVSIPNEKRHINNYTTNEESCKRLKLQIKSLKDENDQLSKELTRFRDRALNFEDDRVAMTTAFNKENADNISQIARLQSQLEKGEATRQALEFDLAVVKKKSNDVLRATTQRESSLTHDNKSLAAEKSALEVKIEDLEKALQIARRVTMEDEKRIAFLMDEKKQVESDKLASEAVLRSHHDKLVGDKQINNAQIEELKKKVKDLEKSLIRQEDELRKKITDVQVLSEREQHAHSELHNLNLRCHALEESVEAERAAHLESKFNAEIIQLKHQETETALSNEKELNSKLKQEFEIATKKSNELESEVQTTKESANEADQKLEKTMQVYSDVRKQLENELSEKTKKLTELSAQLTKQQENFESLKEELNKTRKRQIYLEETYSGNMREVEMLLATYCNESLTKPTIPKKNDKNKSVTPDPKIVLEKLRKCLLALKKDIDDLHRDLLSSKSSEEQMQKDCNIFRDRALTREKDLQQSQHEIMSCRAELDSIRTKQSDYDRECDRMRRDLAEVTGELEQQTHRCKQLEENASGLMDRHKTEMEAHMSYLRELHHALGPHARGITSLTKFTWAEFSVGVREGIDSVLSSLSRYKEKNVQQETSVNQLERTLGEMQREHEASVDRLAKQCREREDEAQKQRKQLEDHYNALLEEMQSRAQKSQGLCDEAWERIRAGDGVSDALHAECSQLRGENGNLQQERNALTCACSLLLGSLYPALRARDDLARQRDLLMRINNDSLIFKNQLRILVETLSEELRKPDQEEPTPTAASSFRKIHPLIRFRVAAVTVLAANRLRIFAQQSNVTMFTCDESSASSNRVLVVAGKSSKSSKTDVAPEESQSDSAMQWLCDQRTVHVVRDTMCGLVDALDKKTGNRKGYMSRAIVKTAKNSFLNILRSTHPMFSSLVYTTNNVVRERTSLICVISEGLERIVIKCKLQEPIKLYSAENSLAILQRHLLNFTERLHATEVEKRNLRSNETKLKSHIQHLTKNKTDLEIATDEIKLLRDRENHLVSRKRFDGVCSELNAALEREQQAQKLLHEQNTKLQELSAKLDEQWTEGTEKENTLSHAVSSLNEVKMELKRCTQSKRLLTKQVMMLEQERDNLGNKMSDAKEALKKAAREKDSLATYFRSVENLLKKTSDNPAELVDSKLPGNISKDHAGPDVIAAQRAVQSFVRVQSSAVSRITSLEDQIASYRSHINALKQELHDACKRENGYVTLSDVNSHIPTRDTSVHMMNGRNNMMDCSTPKDGDFRPLKGVIADESSYSLPQINMNGEK
uniref:coiled-coil domain-containing protein 171-like isoform X1 n=1 Tax=Styela clava TaxID=7725 RepID=UPI0019395274|nr:coiled-coil domain-containing protein 171-like isoform X1 [Styela clava]